MHIMVGNLVFWLPEEGTEVRPSGAAFGAQGLEWRSIRANSRTCTGIAGSWRFQRCLICPWALRIHRGVVIEVQAVHCGSVTGSAVPSTLPGRGVVMVVSAAAGRSAASVVFLDAIFPSLLFDLQRPSVIPTKPVTPFVLSQLPSPLHTPHHHLPGPLPSAVYFSEPSHVLEVLAGPWG